MSFIVNKDDTAADKGLRVAEFAKTNLNGLIELRGDFDTAEAAYQLARKGIYAVLEKVFNAYAAIAGAGDKLVEKSFLEQVKDLQDLRSSAAKEVIKTKATPLELVMLRLVCGDMIKEERAKAYCYVLRCAFAAKVQDSGVSFSQWLVSAGGLEEVRADKSSKADEAVDAAAIRYKDLPALANTTVAVAGGDTNHDTFAVALMRKSGSGWVIVDTTGNKAAVTQTLKVLGKGRTVEQEKQEVANRKREQKAAAKSKQHEIVARKAAAATQELGVAA